mgnify:FL=1
MKEFKRKIKKVPWVFAVILVGYPCFITVIKISFILSGIFAKANVQRII